MKERVRGSIIGEKKKEDIMGDTRKSGMMGENEREYDGREKSKGGIKGKRRNRGITWVKRVKWVMEEDHKGQKRAQ